MYFNYWPFYSGSLHICWVNSSQTDVFSFNSSVEALDFQGLSNFDLIYKICIQICERNLLKLKIVP